MSHMDWIKVVVAALAAFVIGGLWYGPLFGKLWRREQGIAEGSAKPGMAKLLAGNFVLNLIAAAALGYALPGEGLMPAWANVALSALIGAAFVATSIGVIYLYTQKSLKLFLIDGAYWIAAYAGMGAVFALL